MKTFYLFATTQHVALFSVDDDKAKPVLKIHVSGMPKSGRSTRDALPHISFISRASFESNYNYSHFILGAPKNCQEIEKQVFEKKFNETVRWIEKYYQ